MDIDATVPECDVVAVAEDVGGDGVDSDSSAPNPTTTTTTTTTHDLAAFLIEHHRKDFTKAVFDAQRAKQSINARLSHYRVVLELDPMLLLDLDESLSLAHLDANMEKKLHSASVYLIQKASGDDKIYTEDVQLVIRAAYLPAITELQISDWKAQLFDSKTIELSADTVNGCFSNTIVLILKDELVNIAQVGDHVQVIGSHRRLSLSMDMTFQAAVKSLSYSVVFEANNAKKLDWYPTPSNNPSFEMPRTRFGTFENGDNLPNSIVALFEENLSSFTFTQRLVDSFCARQVPVKMWRKLRLSLLLSLVSTPSSIETHTGCTDSSEAVRASINVLLVTDDFTPMHKRVLNEAGSFRRFSEWGSGRKGGLLGNDEGSLNRSVLTDAKDGILFCNLDCATKSDIKSLCEVVDNPVIATRIPKFQDPLLFHSNVILWSSARLMTNVKVKVKQEDSGEAGTLSANLSPILTPIVSKFDICINLKSSSQPHHQEALASHLLFSAVPSGVFDNEDIKDWAPFISHDDFSRFIHTVSSIHVTIPHNCSDFLKAYFTLIRKTFGNLIGGGSGLGGSDSMFVTMESLVRVAMAHARLCLRDEVIIDDVLVSIMLVEESLAFVTGVSVLGFVSLPEDQESMWSLCGDNIGGTKIEEMEEGVNESDRVIMRLYEHAIKVLENAMISIDSSPFSFNEDTAAAIINEMRRQGNLESIVAYNAIRSFIYICRSVLKRDDVQSFAGRIHPFDNDAITNAINWLAQFNRTWDRCEIQDVTPLLTVVKGDLAWFGGKALPRHPLLFSNCFTVPVGKPRVKDLEEKDLTRLRELFGRWDERLDAAFLRIQHLMPRGAPPTVIRNVLAEVMATCEVFGYDARDWPLDWDSPVRLLVQNEDNAMVEGLETTSEMASNNLNSKDPMIVILQHSQPLECVITDAGHPYQWSNSPSDSCHHQRAGYLMLGEMERVSYFSRSQAENASTSSAQSAIKVSSTIHLQRPFTVRDRGLFRSGASIFAKEIDSGLHFAPDVFPFTNYMENRQDSSIEILHFPNEVLCTDMAYGFLAVGFFDGRLMVFTMEDPLKPRLIMRRQSTNMFDTSNSVNLSRRIVRKIDSMDEFEYEFTLLVTRNARVVEVYLLRSQSIEADDENPNSTRLPPLLGFHAPTNDARFSPDGRYMAITGDEGGVWIVHMSYSFTGDLDHQTPDDDFDTTLQYRHFGTPKQIPLDCLFAPMVDAPIAVSKPFVLEDLDFPRVAARNLSDLIVLYCSWNTTSRFLAVSCDNLPYLLIIDAVQFGVVFKIDAATSTYSVAFHPTKPYLLAFSNRHGDVHIVDLTAELPDDVSITPPNKQPRFVYPPRQILRHNFKRVHPTVNDALSDAPNRAEAINGLLWSEDGTRLYVATDSRVLMHTVLEREPPSLHEIVCRKFWDDGINELKTLDDDGAEMLEQRATELMATKPWAHHWKY
ncbi:Minichromosome maintenance domain-containing protein 2 [Rhizoclosmatium sp. JEL0117]|nr:Minichromosome maintenance domain-containing protein 2 [Rhizoclosmatium sp. JEL0117]